MYMSQFSLRKQLLNLKFVHIHLVCSPMSYVGGACPFNVASLIYSISFHIVLGGMVLPVRLLRYVSKMPFF